MKRDLGLPLDYPGDRWTCPKTGIVIAKDIAGNLEQRKRILTLANDPDERPGILAICKLSKLAWINLFAWTHVVVEQTATGRKATTRPTRRFCPGRWRGAKRRSGGDRRARTGRRQQPCYRSQEASRTIHVTNSPNV